MADAKVSALTALSGVNIADGDLFPMVDLSDTTMAASGTDKSTTANDIATAVKARALVAAASVSTPGAGFGTAAVVQSRARLTHALSITGLSTSVTPITVATSGGFDSTVAASIIGVSLNGGTSAAFTITLVEAELINLA
jgi:hypothetical protein